MFAADYPIPVSPPVLCLPRRRSSVSGTDPLKRVHGGGEGVRGILPPQTKKNGRPAARRRVKRIGDSRLASRRFAGAAGKAYTEKLR